MKMMTSVTKDMDSERLNPKEITLNKQEEQRKREEKQMKIKAVVMKMIMYL